MNMRTALLAGVLWGIALGGVGAEPAMELGLFQAYRGGGGFVDEGTGEELDIDESGAVGFHLSVMQTPGRYIEFRYSRQQSELVADGPFTGNPLFDLDIHYAHVGGAVFYGNQALQPFLAGGMGATYLDPRAQGLDSETRFSLSLGGGVRLHFTERVGMRIEGLGMFTLMDSDTALFCAAGRCALRVDGSGFSQFQLGAGVFLVF